jgi:nucleotide-binding universal stress UspA family protein
MLVHGYLHPFRYGIPFDPYAVRVPPPSEEATRMLDEVAAGLRDRCPSLTVAVRQAPGGAAAALVDKSHHAQLVVVGSRGHGGFAGLLLGSVSTQVAAHARCPVLVVRPAEQPAPPPGQPVVVGVDGSTGSGPALDFAIDEAARRGLPLAVVHVWSLGESRPARETYAQTEAADRAAAKTLLSDAAATARQRHPELSVEERLVHALDPQQTLLEASREASVVVVGSRGRGGFTGLLLGSVSQALVHHAHCPVVIAHPRAERS